MYKSTLFIATLWSRLSSILNRLGKIPFMDVVSEWVIQLLRCSAVHGTQILDIFQMLRSRIWTIA